ncbi:Putative cytoplasmic protein [Fulvivirga imtechensis AK7]|uniref:Putative cytoplasmic protein n=1 Tax=Fulvivirga imtechensis AK7 TaxID=1237149 RepID=L8JML1_9BACT|nr:crosslink repair DNA glycosylase YcaQ family protein [Fulvivirga imtechensis]ELR69473.1 Putative cytoplasmic protein [Fulvivirga imtechensis AK7]
MKPKRTFSKAEARNIIIHSQLLSDEKQQSRDIIRQLGYVQIDTLAVAERAHHHVFHARNTDYSKDELATMLKNRQVFEYWSHAASYLPMDDYRYSLIRKREYAKGKSHWFKHDKKMTRYVVKRIKEEGPLQSKDFKDPRNVSGAWYDWKPAKIALEQLFMEGKLMVAERVNFQKVYDLTERVLPPGINTSMPTAREFYEYLIRKALSAHGLASLAEISYLRKGIREGLQKAIKKLVREGEVLPVKVEGQDQMYYTLTNTPEPKCNKKVHILSPFDNLVIQRKRTLELFDFDYQLECYLPEKKRKFGYYCLPLLYKDRLIGKFDPKADRATGIFTIRTFWLEPDFTPDDIFLNELAISLKNFMAFCGCYKLEVDTSITSPVPQTVQQFVNDLQ